MNYTEDIINVIGPDYRPNQDTPSPFIFNFTWSTTIDVNHEEDPIGFEDEYYRAFIDKINEKRDKFKTGRIIQRQVFFNRTAHVYEGYHYQLVATKNQDGSTAITFFAAIEVPFGDLPK